MKKTLVALAVLAAAGSVQAIELYNQDQVTVNFTGDVEVRYKKGVEDGSEFKQEINDADFGFDTRYAVNDDLQVGAFWEFAGGNVKEKVAVGDVYMGLYSNTFGSIKFGKLATQIDDAGIGSDHVFGIRSFIQDAELSFDESVRYDLDKGAFYGGLGFVQFKGAAAELQDATIFDAKVGARFADFDLTAYYGMYDTGSDALANAKANLWAAEARYAGIENLNLELGYYASTDSKDNADDVSNNTIAFAADYTLQAWKFAAGVSSSKYDEKFGPDMDKDTVVGWFVNAGYALAPSTTAYVEVGGDDGYSNLGTEANPDIKQNGTGVGIGLKAEF
ncbi:porin [Vibrio hangzhouensis]|uniref:porin n=1 Tax=Vibrio hangzhouensis TaxID=462991 RepID=UPI001C950CAA|nr:porin [Vibrio hangzhouensis]MBY6197905.1 porin [Vibrio hangzhouensis]